MTKWDRATRLDSARAEVIEQFSGTTSDALILAREACARLVADDLRQIEITQETKDSKIYVRARA